jgi:thiol-disulfide isomerase/thioredoxin
MANIVEVLRKYIRPYYYYIITLVVLIIFIFAGYYAYNQFSKTKASRFKDVANVNRRNKDAVVYFFHVDWCPHCKKALPEWNSFKSQNNGLEINGYEIKCVDIDCTKETSDITRMINQYKIDSYPTIKLIRDEQTIDFESKITSSSLNKFVETMLN